MPTVSQYIRTHVKFILDIVKYSGKLEHLSFDGFCAYKCISARPNGWRNKINNKRTHFDV